MLKNPTNFKYIFIKTTTKTNTYNEQTEGKPI